MTDWRDSPYMTPRARVLYPAQAIPPELLRRSAPELGLEDGLPPARIPHLVNPALSLYAGLRGFAYGSSANGLGAATLRFGPSGRYDKAPQRSARSVRMTATEPYSASQLHVPATYVGQVRPPV